MYVRFGYGYSRQSNYCALVTSVQNTLVSYRKVRFLPLTLIYATLGFYVSLVAKHYLSFYAHTRLYFTHKMTEKRYLSANIALYATYFLLITATLTHYSLINKTIIIQKLLRICQLSGQGIEPCNVRWMGVCTSHGTLPALPPRYPLRYPITFLSIILTSFSFVIYKA